MTHALIRGFEAGDEAGRGPFLAWLHDQGARLLDGDGIEVCRAVRSTHPRSEGARPPEAAWGGVRVVWHCGVGVCGGGLAFWRGGGCWVWLFLARTLPFWPPWP